MPSPSPGGGKHRILKNVDEPLRELLLRVGLTQFQYEFEKRGLWSFTVAGSCALADPAFVGAACGTHASEVGADTLSFAMERYAAETQRLDAVDCEILPFLKPLQRRKLRAAMRESLCIPGAAACGIHDASGRVPVEGKDSIGINVVLT